MTKRAALLSIVMAGWAASLGAQPVGTAFTYQGRLTDAGNPANGAYDLQLALFDAASGGAQVGATLTRDDVVVTNGLFTASLDFGAVFAGSKRWLELRVRPGASTGAYTTLAGRQELTPSPYAAFSSAAPWGGISGKPPGFADDIDNDSLGTVTGITAGAGLTGGTITTAGTLAVNFGGVGSQDFVSRADHDHLSQTWVGSAFRGLDVRTFMNGGTGVFGMATVTGGAGVGVGGQSDATAGTGVSGSATAFSGITRGVRGDSASTEGVGVFGASTPTTGTGVGVWGRGSSTGGLGGYFENASGGPALGVSAGGIRFNDGTTQTSAALGDITGVTAGAGLSGGATSGNASLSVSFGGSGTTNQVARSNHDHLGGFWNGPGGLYLVNTDPGTPGFWNDSLYVEVLGSQARAIVGYATPTTGQTVGVWGQSDSATGYGVLGYAPATTGVNYGVYGRSDSSTGYAGFFEGSRVGIPNGKLTFGLTTRQVIDLNSPAYGIGVQGGVVYFRTEPPGGMFTWFLGGSHSNTQNDPGPGGVRQMRLDGGGNLFVRGSYFSGGADFAEMLPAAQGLEPGDVLAIGADGQMTLSTEPYQDSLAGVYSTRPGLIGGAADGQSTEGKIPLAVAGVVPVKVTDEGGPIAAGDALTSSSTPGHAMKAAKVRVGGIAFFPGGVVIGKALEPLHSPTGVIQALVVLQ